MSITRSQIPESIDLFEGGDVSPGTQYLQTMQGIGAEPITRQELDAEQEKLKGFLSPPKDDPSFFDLAAELGAGLLSTPNTGGASPFVGLGVGFQSFNNAMAAKKAKTNEFNQQLKMLAMQNLEREKQKEQQLLQRAAEVDFEINLELAKKGEAGNIFADINTPQARAMAFLLEVKKNPNTEYNQADIAAALAVLNQPEQRVVETKDGESIVELPSKYSGVASFLTPGTATTETGTEIPIEAITFLQNPDRGISDEEAIRQFNEKYGAGQAQKYMKR